VCGSLFNEDALSVFASFVPGETRRDFVVPRIIGGSVTPKRGIDRLKTVPRYSFPVSVGIGTVESQSGTTKVKKWVDGGATDQIGIVGLVRLITEHQGSGLSFGIQPSGDLPGKLAEVFKLTPTVPLNPGRDLVLPDVGAPRVVAGTTRNIFRVIGHELGENVPTDLPHFNPEILARFSIENEVHLGHFITPSIP